eukprot:CAMPEP_0172361308 /NCGR_PEP_ID=MMETSP1060-20121228/5158_1 /TAXON_ID=37318 /ORGANISM="Pseudo-nitzschia pungens, Strain cf. cingulata" /LENGTH=521 /DNA_ID=CAMNT_0013083533 /DNA_START=20 /DNA_END=1585 /DNA_ORIENTATION=-
MTESEIPESRQLPVTLISGFLGAGKSTLLRNILEAKHGDEKFRCAVLVNDMAELNIDKNLIESSGLVQSDEVISMQNGCVCCNLSGDLIEQIVKLTQNKETPFDYLIIEASGVSEPAAIAALFEECDDDHDHSEHGMNLGEVAKMDTIVTVVDSAEFLQNLDLMDDPDRKDYPRLLVDQVEYANVVLLNKTDLVNESQLEEVKERVSLLAGEGVKIIECENSTIDPSLVVDTKLFNAKDFDLSKFLQKFEVEQSKSCCKKSEAKGESPCCKRARTIDSGKSQVILPSKKVSNTRHQENYKITSFVYRAHRPFAPMKLYETFIDAFFMMEEDEEDEDEEESKDEEGDEEMKVEDADADENIGAPPEKKKKIDDEQAETDSEMGKARAEAIQRMQEEGAAKKKLRIEAVGSLLRMKGYLWQGNSHDLIGYISAAGNVSRLESPGKWNCLDPRFYQGSDEEQREMRKSWVAPYGDRRQELVFIGQDLNHKSIQELLDSCLLTDEQMAMGVDGWKATFGDIMLDV